MNQPREPIDGMHTASGLHLVIHGNAVERPPKPVKRRRRWPFALLVLVAVGAVLASYLRPR